MRLFCLLCIPLVFLLRRSFSPGGGSILALFLGSVAVAVQYFFGPLIAPGAFGFSRWLSGFVEIVSLPVLVPFVVCLLFVALKIFPSSINSVNFTLLWLVPIAAFTAVSGSYPPSPIPLVLVPVLWLAQAMGIPFLAACMARNPRWYVIVPAVLGMAALPLAATSSWWAFFSQRTFMGILFLSLSLVPAALSGVVYCMGKGRTLSMVERPHNAMISRSSPSATPEQEGNPSLSNNLQ